MKTIYQEIAAITDARRNCIKSGNQEWQDRHEETLERIQHNLPSGSGIDTGCLIDLEKSGWNKIVITFGFHHMNDNGYYDGWTDHKAIITPAFDGINIKITGRDRNNIKEYLYDVLEYALNEEYKA